MSSYSRRSGVFRSGRGVMSSQPDLFPASASELLGESHEVFGLWEVIERVLGSSLREMAKDRGGYLHDPARMFAVWMYGFMPGRASSRQLEDACRYDVRFSYLAGGTTPDHSTLSRFRERFGDVLPELLVSVCKEAQKVGLVGSRPVVVDGTKVPCVSSQWKKALDASMEEDARTMLDGQGKHINGYNAQVAVDIESTFIVGSVMSNRANDSGQLSGVLDSVEETTGEYPPEVVADSGYDSSVNHDAAQAANCVSYIHPRKEHLRVFKPDESGALRCRAGHIPSLTHTVKSGNLYDVYRVSQCRTCEHKLLCKAPRHQKEMTVRAGTKLGAREDNWERTRAPYGQDLLRQRGKTVELVFARLKAGFGFRRFKLKNLKGSGLEFSLLCTAYNLRLLLSLFSWVLEQILNNIQPKTTPNLVLKQLCS